MLEPGFKARAPGKRRIRHEAPVVIIYRLREALAGSGRLWGALAGLWPPGALLATLVVSFGYPRR